MRPSTDTICVSGAGTAGLSAAITAARCGARVTVFERHREVGHRFHGDFQGLENWTTDGDVLEELSAIGIEPSFAYTPVSEVVVFDADGRDHLYRDTSPLFYLVERGPRDGSLDRGLGHQAASLGVQLRFNSECRQLPEGGIVAEGPRRADIIAVGYVFETDAGDGSYCVLSGRFAHQGYAYLLVHAGRGVLASCLFGDFHNERYYLGQATDFFESKLGIGMRHVRHFGGAGSFSVPRTARKGRILYAGECAGFQDAFAGFGIRYALLSGHLAARALTTGQPERYDELWRTRIGAQLRASIVNRYLYAGLGGLAIGFLAERNAGSRSIRSHLKRRYAMSITKSLLYPVARRSIARRTQATRPEAKCNCTWCRCHASLTQAEPESGECIDLFKPAAGGEPGARTHARDPECL